MEASFRPFRVASLIDVMEFLLNIIWLLVSAGAFVFWRPWRIAGRQSGGQRIHFNAIGALACAIFLLFPVISLTDDLHTERIAVEDSSSAVMKTRSVVHGCFRTSRFPFFAALTVSANSVDAQNVVSGLIIPFDIQPFRASVTPTNAGRSPPATR